MPKPIKECFLGLIYDSFFHDSKEKAYEDAGEDIGGIIDNFTCFSLKYWNKNRLGVNLFRFFLI